MTAWQLYWILNLDSVRQTILMFAIIGCILGGFTHISIGYFYSNEDLSKVSYLIKRYVITFVIGIVLATFLPSTKQMFTIMVLPKIINNEQIKELPSLAVKATKEWLLREITQNGTAKKLIKEVVKEEAK